MDKVYELLKNVETLPASPALLPKLAGALDNINTDIHEIVNIIMYDSSLTAKLLQISNSAYFGPSTPITTVGEALNQIGYDAVYLLAAAISGSACLHTSSGVGLDSTILWKHSVTTAFGSQHVAQAAGLNGNMLFTAGLLHDVGKVVLAEAYHKNYTAMFDPAKRGSLSLVEWENANYGYDHAQVGAALLEHWKLPAQLVVSVRFHHEPAAAGEFAPLAACVCLGNILSRTLEQPKFVLDPTDREAQPALQLLKLTAEDLSDSWNRIRENWEFVQNLYELRK